jgi:excisionase family DNA binding protein
MSNHQILLPAQVCNILQISKRTLQRITEEGTLPNIRIRGSIRYTQQALDELVRAGGVHDDRYRSFIRKMTPIGDLADAAKKEWERGSAALVGFYERLERVMFDGGIPSTLRVKIAEIDSLIAEQQANLGVLRECCLYKVSADVAEETHDNAAAQGLENDTKAPQQSGGR